MRARKNKFQMLLPLVAAALPFFLWPVEAFLAWPYVVEELAKGMLFFASPRQVISQGLLAGIFFSFSENILYLINSAYGASSSLLIKRILLTSPLHLITFILLTWPHQKKSLLPITFLNILIHHLYNNYLLVSISPSLHL